MAEVEPLSEEVLNSAIEQINARVLPSTPENIKEGALRQIMEQINCESFFPDTLTAEIRHKRGIYSPLQYLATHDDFNTAFVRYIPPEADIEVLVGSDPYYDM